MGGGPAGLTAALYLARFRRAVRVVDSGASRARWIPRSHNVPGFVSGVHGEDFLQALRRQAAGHGATVGDGRVEVLGRSDGGFEASAGGERLQARMVILATGVVETVPPAPGMAEAIRAGRVRVCPICDGFEAQGRTIAVIGSGEHAAREALFLRTYARSVSLILPPAAELGPDMIERLRAAGVEVLAAEAGALRPGADGVEAVLADGSRRGFEAVYSAFGVTPQVKLARGLGVDLDSDGRIRVDERQQTSAPGLYAVGDVVRGLNQISVAVGEAAIAATAVHNRLGPNFC